MYSVIGRFDVAAPLENLNRVLRNAGFTPDEYTVTPSSEQVLVTVNSKDFARRDAALGLLQLSGAQEVWAEERTS